MKAKKASSAFTLILMDINHFKEVNDTYGHRISDQVCQHVAKTCQTQLNGEEFFARYGGEEFVLALKGYPLSEGKSLVSQMRSYLTTQPLVTIEEVILLR